MSKTNRAKEEDNFSNNKVDVVIIGAGWAGLSAARHFMDAPETIQFVVLEARHEIGGRCRSVVLEDGATIAELGAQWIHNATDGSNPVYRIAKEAGIAMVASDLDSAAAYQKRAGDSHNEYRRVPSAHVDEKYYRPLMKKGFLKYQAKQQDKDPDITLRACVEKFWLENQKAATPDNRAWLEYFLDSEIVQEYAASLEDLSTHWWDAGHDAKGGDVHVAQQVGGGYKGVLDYFAAPIHDQIRLNAAVTCIDWSPSGDHCVAVNYNDTASSPKDCSIIARRVLITVPLGVLKAKTIQFIPELPQHKQDIIDKMGVGLLNKCLMLWDESDAANLPWPQNREWIEVVAEAGQQGHWTEFFNPYPLNGRPLLCAFTAGRVAARIENELNDQEIQQQALATLRSLFSHANIPNPKQVVVTKWGQDEFARGSYSYNAYGAKHRYRDRLADPIGVDPNNYQLYFAGEACHSKFPSTTHGAFLSGLHTAQQIVVQRNQED